MTIDGCVYEIKQYLANNLSAYEGMYVTKDEWHQIAEWLEELKAMRNLDKTNYSDGYEKGRQDAIDEFKKGFYNFTHYEPCSMKFEVYQEDLLHFIENLKDE